MYYPSLNKLNFPCIYIGAALDWIQLLVITRKNNDEQSIYWFLFTSLPDILKYNNVFKRNTKVCAEIAADWRQTAHRESKRAQTQRSWRRPGQTEWAGTTERGGQPFLPWSAVMCIHSLSFFFPLCQSFFFPFILHLSLPPSPFHFSTSFHPSLH